jgi:hypothetical protein
MMEWADVDERLAPVEALRAMRLPVGPVEQMIAESVPYPRELPDRSSGSPPPPSGSPPPR